MPKYFLPEYNKSVEANTLDEAIAQVNAGQNNNQNENNQPTPTVEPVAEQVSKEN